MAIKKGLKVGDAFEDGGFKYKVKAVNTDGSYVSIRADKAKEKTSEDKTAVTNTDGSTENNNQ